MSTSQAATGSVGDGAGAFAPDTSWKSERKRRSMLGLAYGSGRAVVVPSEAAALQEAVEEPAGSIRLLQKEGHAALGENRALDAIALFTKAVLLEPTVAEHYIPLGRALLSFKLEAQARAAWETGHELDPENAQLTFHVADMAYRKGDHERASRLFDRTVQLDPQHAAAWGRLARLAYFEEDDDKAWRATWRAEELGETIPALLRARLAARSPEPLR